MDEKAFLITKKIQDIYLGRSEEVIQAIRSAPNITFRVSTLKSDDEVLEELRNEGFDFHQSEIEGCYILESTESNKRLSDSPAVMEGKIYIQGISSMLCSIMLDPKPSEKILDLCAAPGSKTSHIASLVGNNAEIVAVEKNPKRVLKLKANLGRLGVTCAQVVHEDGYDLSNKLPGYRNYFDRVLVDAPCSNEGYIVIDDPNSYSFWNKNKYKDMVWQQKGLLLSGFNMLKPEGTLIYSTCTFSVEENEAVVDWFLKKVGDIAAMSPLNSISANVMHGITEWKSKQFSPDLSKSIRILPDGTFRPFYIAKITKNG